MLVNRLSFSSFSSRVRIQCFFVQFMTLKTIKGYPRLGLTIYRLTWVPLQSDSLTIARKAIPVMAAVPKGCWRNITGRWQLEQGKSVSQSQYGNPKELREKFGRCISVYAKGSPITAKAACKGSTPGCCMNAHAALLGGAIQVILHRGTAPGAILLTNFWGAALESDCA